MAGIYLVGAGDHEDTQPPVERAAEGIGWLFRQKDRLLTCSISRAAEAAFEVVTVPHWDVRRASVERFSCAMKALERPAEIAASLRESGWSAAAYTQ